MSGKLLNPSLMWLYLRVEHHWGALFGKAVAFIANIKLGWKGLTKTNTLAYYQHLLIMDIKSFITLGPSVNVIKLFSSANKLECFSFANLFSTVWSLQVKLVGYHRGEPLKDSQLILALTLLKNIKATWKCISRTNSVSYLALSKGQIKKSQNIDYLCQYNIYFFTLFIIVSSQNMKLQGKMSVSRMKPGLSLLL